jgi:hypothetical protein
MPKRSQKASPPRVNVLAPYSLTRAPVQEALLRDLTEKALGTDGQPDAFVLLLQLIREALSAGHQREAANIIFRAQTHVFNASGHHTEALMIFHDQIREQVAHYLTLKW